MGQGSIGLGEDTSSSGLGFPTEIHLIETDKAKCLLNASTRTFLAMEAAWCEEKTTIAETPSIPGPAFRETLSTPSTSSRSTCSIFSCWVTEGRPPIQSCLFSVLRLTLRQQPGSSEYPFRARMASAATAAEPYLAYAKPLFCPLKFIISRNSQSGPTELNRGISRSSYASREI